MVSHWSSSDSNSPQISTTFLSILADLNNAVVWMVSTRPLITKSCRTFINPLVTVPHAPITHGITVVLLMLVLSVLFPVALISLPLHFFMKSSNLCIDASTLSLMLANPLPPSFLDTYSFSTSGVLLFSCPFPLSSTSIMVPNISQRGQPRCLSLWWDFGYIVWFRVGF